MNPLNNRITPSKSIPLNLMTGKEFAKSGTLYVVMDKDRSTVMKEPGLETPFRTTVKKIAEDVAREAGGVAVPYLEALKLVMKHPRNAQGQ